MVQRIKMMWSEGLEDEQIAAQLTQEGYRSPTTTARVLVSTVADIRQQHGWLHPFHQLRRAKEKDGYLTLTGLLEQVPDVKRHWVYGWIHNGKIDPDYIRYEPESRMYLFRNDPALINHIRQLALVKLKKGEALK